MGKGSRNRKSRELKMGWRRLECYFEEYRDGAGQPCVRLREKSSNNIVVLLGSSMTKTAFLQLVAEAQTLTVPELFESDGVDSYVLVSGHAVTTEDGVEVLDDAERVVTLSIKQEKLSDSDRVASLDWNIWCEVYINALSSDGVLGRYHYQRPQTANDRTLTSEAFSIFDDMVMKGTVGRDAVLHSVFIARSREQMMAMEV